MQNTKKQNNSHLSSFQALPSFGNNLSEDPHSVVIAHVLKVHIIYLASRQKTRNIYYHIRQMYTIFLLQRHIQRCKSSSKLCTWISKLETTQNV